MTATRIARAGRIRFFIGLGVLVLTMGFVAMFHSSQQQLDESRYKLVRKSKLFFIRSLIAFITRISAMLTLAILLSSSQYFHIAFFVSLY